MTNFSGFKWLDLLEKEFDKSFVSLDQCVRNVSEEYELEEIYDNERRLLANIGHCFVQLVHKSQTIFQVNAKLEAEVINLKEELNENQKALNKCETEKSYLLCLLQSCLLENSILKSKSQSLESNEDQEKLAEKVQLRLANDLAAIQKADWEEFGRREKLNALDAENQQLRKQISELESEIVGARLDAKYLDKELAGRIQQIQILLASNATQEHKQQVWAQIEAEMHLQRSKTIANMCYSKQKLRDQQRQANQTSEDSASSNAANGHVKKPNEIKPVKSRIKQVHLHKHDADELGMAILGGVEHGLPIIISEVFPNSAVGRNQKIYAGDVILGVNGDSFTEMGHHDAVKYLSALRGTIRFDLENNIEADIDEVCDMDTRLYQFHISEEEKATTLSASTNRMTLSYPGKAKDVRSTSTNSPTTKVSAEAVTTEKNIEERPKAQVSPKPQQQQPKKSELPKVHAFASPSKAKTSSSSETQSPKTSTL